MKNQLLSILSQSNLNSRLWACFTFQLVFLPPLLLDYQKHVISSLFIFKCCKYRTWCYSVWLNSSELFLISENGVSLLPAEAEFRSHMFVAVYEIKEIYHFRAGYQGWKMQLYLGRCHSSSFTDSLRTPNEHSAGFPALFGGKALSLPSKSTLLKL